MRFMKKITPILAAILYLTAGGSSWADGGAGELRQVNFSDYAAHVYRASSSLESEGPYSLGPYGMHLLFDGDGYTGWSEGAAGDGRGEVLWLRLDPGADTLLLRNGFARRQDLFEKNNRVRSLDLSIWGGVLPAGMVTEIGPMYVMAPETESRSLVLEDTPELREYELPFDRTVLEGPCSISEKEFRDFARALGLPETEERRDLFLRMEITDVYPGSLWNDTCLTELRVFSEENFKATEVYTDDIEAAGAIHYDTPERYRRTLYRDREFLFDPYLVSDNGRWCVAFQSPAEAGGRVETEYVLFHLPYPELHENRDFTASRAEGLLPVDFEEEGDAVYLLFDDGSRIRLE